MAKSLAGKNPTRKFVNEIFFDMIDEHSYANNSRMFDDDDNRTAFGKKVEAVELLLLNLIDEHFKGAKA